MSVDDVVKLIDAVTKLVAALAWPVLIAVVLVRFGPALRDFFQSLGEFSVKGAGFEASAKRKQAEAVAALSAAATAKPDQTQPALALVDSRETVDLVQDVVTPRVLRRAARATVLWVDDRPDNNTYERQSLEALGMSFVLARSTEEALRMLRTTRFNAIVSDMSRPPDHQAGYTLLDQLRASGDQTPFVIYAGSNAPEHKAEARKHGALGSTNKASELFEYVVRAVGGAA